MTKGVILFGVFVGGTIGLYIPKLFGGDGFGIVNVITAIMGVVIGLIGMATAVHYYGRIR